MNNQAQNLFGAAGLALAVVATPVAADEAGDKSFRSGWYVAPMVSWLRADPDRCTDDGLGLMVAGGKRGDFASLEVWGQFHTLPYDCDYTVVNEGAGPGDPPRIGANDSGDLTLTGGGLALLVGPFSDDVVLSRFFGIVAFGTNQRKDHPKETEDLLTIFGDAGVGYMQPMELFGLNMNARAEIRYRYDVQQPPRTASDRDPQPPPHDDYQDWLFSIGFQIPLSAVPEPEPAPEPVQLDVVPAELTDFDNDGVIDELDQCPQTPEGSYVDSAGCPEPAPAASAATPVPPPPLPEAVEIEDAQAGDRIVLKGVTFETNSEMLQVNAETILDGVADRLIARPDLRVEIGGHSDDRGAASYNKDLSQRRADSVLEYLVGRGVDRERLSAVGYGEEQPVESNDTSDGRARNRRVELRVLE